MMTDPCKSNNLRFKLDLRIAAINEDEVIVDGMTSEIAKPATKHKLYKDKLKSILASKCHVNNFLTSVPYIRAEDIRRLRFPIMQIMGMDVHVYVLRIPCRGIYVVDNACSFSFPCSLKSLRTDVEKMIDSLSLVEVSIIYFSKINNSLIKY